MVQRVCPCYDQLLQFVAVDGNPHWSSGEDILLARRLGSFRHVRSRRVEAVYGSNPPFLGVCELFWPTHSAFEACAIRAPSALARIVDHAGVSAVFLAQGECVA